MNKKAKLPHGWVESDKFYLRSEATRLMEQCVGWCYPGIDRRDKMEIVEDISVLIKAL